MSKCYDGALIMPGSYAVMNAEEMTYVEGGADPLYVEERMLYKNYCSEIAYKYTAETGLSQPRIAMEIYAHAVLTLMGISSMALASVVNVPGVKEFANYLVTRGRIIDLGGDSLARVAVFAAIWCAVPSPGELVA